MATAEGFGINATRLIYSEGANSITVTVRNTMPELPYLVQATVTMTPNDPQVAPFNVTPPLFRLEPNTTNQIRIAGQTGHLPKDRESVFYFNARAIPASRALPLAPLDSTVSGAAQFGVGNIIKVFYLPAGLAGSSGNAQRDLQFERSDNGLKVTNTSPYFINLAGLNVAGQKLSLQPPTGIPMIAPFESHIYPTSVTPPMQRFDPGEELALRIRRTGVELPADRESVYFISMKAIPGQQAPQDRQTSPQVTLTVVSNMKLFYRPKGLPTGGVASAAPQLKFSLQGDTLVADNPTPFWLTFSHLSVGDYALDSPALRLMVPPKGQQQYRLPVGTRGDVIWQLIDEDGWNTRSQRWSPSSH